MNQQTIPAEGKRYSPEFLDRYLDYLIVFGNKQAATQATVRSTLRDFCQFTHYLYTAKAYPDADNSYKDTALSAMQIGELYALTRQDIEAYLSFQESVAGNSTNTRRKKMAILRQFFDYLTRNAQDLGGTWAQGNPMTSLTNPAISVEEPTILPRWAVQKLICSASGTQEARDRAIIHLFVTTGISLSEGARLNWSDLDGSTLQIRRGGAVRVLYLTDACLETLKRYRAECAARMDRPAAEEYLPMFLAERSSRRMTPRAIQQRIRKVAVNAGLGNMQICASVLQDTATANLLRCSSEADRPQIMAYLGHTSSAALRRFRNIRCLGDTCGLTARKALAGSDLSLIQSKEGIAE